MRRCEGLNDKVKYCTVSCSCLSVAMILLYDHQVRRCESLNDKVKYCVLLCGDDDDPEVVKAASGALAMLTQVGTTVFFASFLYFSSFLYFALSLYLASFLNFAYFFIFWVILGPG